MPEDYIARPLIVERNVGPSSSQARVSGVQAVWGEENQGALTPPPASAQRQTNLLV
jgi:hypothetical protein